MNRFRALLRVLTAAAVLVLIALCCWQCIDIYISGTQANAPAGVSIFTMPDVVYRLTKLSPVFFVCLGVIIFSAILHISKKNEYHPPFSTLDYRLKQLKSSFDALPEAAKKEESHRCILRTAFGIVLVLLFLPALVYLLDVSHFTDWNLEAVLADMLLHILPWLMLSLIAATAASLLIRKSIEREIRLLRSTPTPAQKPPCPPPSNHHNTGIRCVLFFAAVVFIVLGIINGGLYDVLVKAINICTECIGLG